MAEKNDSMEPVYFSIENKLRINMICSNQNRMKILSLLNECPNHEMQAEKIAGLLGISHRTVLYHLDVLQDFDIVEVRQFRKKGNKMMRSVWGLRLSNGNLDKVMEKISKKCSIPVKDLLRKMDN